MEYDFIKYVMVRGGEPESKGWGENWIGQWKKFSKARQVGLCKEMSCTELAEVGTYVELVDAEELGGFIVPLCRKHSARVGEKIRLFSNTPLAPIGAE